MYRLATLLTGDRRTAAAVIDEVLAAQPDLGRLDSARMDRLTLLRSRERKAAVLLATGVPSEASAALAAMSSQQREAWVLGWVYRLSERELAQAMDCSRAAARQHLRLAEERMTAAGDQTEAAGRMLDFSRSLQVPPRFYRARRQDRRRRALLVVALCLLTLALLVMAIRLFIGSLESRTAPAERVGPVDAKISERVRMRTPHDMAVSRLIRAAKLMSSQPRPDGRTPASCS